MQTIERKYIELQGVDNGFTVRGPVQWSDVICIVTEGKFTRVRYTNEVTMLLDCTFDYAYSQLSKVSANIRQFDAYEAGTSDIMQNTPMLTNKYKIAAALTNLTAIDVIEKVDTGGHKLKHDACLINIRGALYIIDADFSTELHDINIDEKNAQAAQGQMVFVTM